MSSSKNQSIIAIGFGLVLIAAFLVYYGISQPKVNETSIENLQSYASSVNDFSYSDSQSTYKNDTKQAKTSRAAAYGKTENTEKSESNSLAVSYPLDLNKCTYEELLTVDSIGSTRAQAILEYRDYLGGYTSVSQLKDIKGIGDGVYAKISPYFTV